VHTIVQVIITNLKPTLNGHNYLQLHTHWTSDGRGPLDFCFLCNSWLRLILPLLVKKNQPQSCFQVCNAGEKTSAQYMPAIYLSPVIINLLFQPNLSLQAQWIKCLNTACTSSCNESISWPKQLLDSSSVVCCSQHTIAVPVTVVCCSVVWCCLL
jgi:hypothetical protein